MEIIYTIVWGILLDVLSFASHEVSQMTQYYVSLRISKSSSTQNKIAKGTTLA